MPDQKPHTDKLFDKELGEVSQRVERMGKLAGDMLDASVRAFNARNTTLAREIIDEDTQVNRLEKSTDQLCLEIIARRQPMASDLRFLVLSMKAVVDIERIGDIAVNISERTLDLARSDLADTWDELSRMGILVMSMVRDGVKAFVESDEALAADVLKRDIQVDRLYVKLFSDLIDLMGKRPDVINQGIHVQSVAKWLERAGDHAVNLAEYAVFRVKGHDGRHAGRS